MICNQKLVSQIMLRNLFLSVTQHLGKCTAVKETRHNTFEMISRIFSEVILLMLSKSSHKDNFAVEKSATTAISSPKHKTLSHSKLGKKLHRTHAIFFVVHFICMQSRHFPYMTGFWFWDEKN